MRIFIILLVRYTCTFQARALIEEEHLMPVFDKHSINISAIAETTVSLPCAVQRKGDYKLIWLNPRKTLISKDDSRFIDDSRISVERPKIKDWNLMIREVRYNDSGEYMCQINTKPVEIKRLYLFVQVPPEIIEDFTNTNIDVIEGTTIDLVCNASGVPLPVVTWYKQSNLLKGADQLNGGEESTLIGEVLILHNISRYCDGIYECNAENGIPPLATRTFDVTVLFSPEVRVPTKRIGQLLGKETILECKVSASPHESIVWTKNGSALPLHMYKYWTELYDEGQHEKTLYLNIIDIDREDFGYYTCHASNTLGKDSETTILYEYKVPDPRSRLTTASWRPSPLTTMLGASYHPNNAIITPPLYSGAGHKNKVQYGGSAGSVYYNYNSKGGTSGLFCNTLLLVTMSCQSIIYQFIKL